jgi:hypothetical protein
MNESSSRQYILHVFKSSNENFHIDTSDDNLKSSFYSIAENIISEIMKQLYANLLSMKSTKYLLIRTRCREFDLVIHDITSIESYYMIWILSRASTH